MEIQRELYLDEQGKEMSREDYQKSCEDDTEVQPISQQPTVQEFPQTLRTHRKSERKTEATTQIQTPPVKERVTENLQPRPSWFKKNIFHIGLGMFTMAVLSIVVVSYVYPAYVSFTDRLQCGQNLICHTDIDVGHNGKSHFITEYWHNQAIVIECSQVHPEQGKTYALRMPSGDDEPRIVSLHPAYINMHGKPGYPDLEVYVYGFELPAILYNTGSGFSEEQQ